jgi:hypothetical protein
MIPFRMQTEAQLRTRLYYARKSTATWPPEFDAVICRQ